MASKKKAPKKPLITCDILEAIARAKAKGGNRYHVVLKGYALIVGEAGGFNEVGIDLSCEEDSLYSLEIRDCTLKLNVPLCIYGATLKTEKGKADDWEQYAQVTIANCTQVGTHREEQFIDVSGAFMEFTVENSKLHTLMFDAYREAGFQASRLALNDASFKALHAHGRVNDDYEVCDMPSFFCESICWSGGTIGILTWMVPPLVVEGYPSIHGFGDGIFHSLPRVTNYISVNSPDWRIFFRSLCPTTPILACGNVKHLAERPSLPEPPVD